MKEKAISVSICVFVYNEEHLIERTLRGLEDACGDRAFEAHVIINGSTDRSAEIVAACAREDRRIVSHELKIGDKSKAWNYYVHELRVDAPTHCFLDGDILPGRESIKYLAEALENDPEAYTAVGLPGSGRSREQWYKILRNKHGLSGNLYAVSREAITLIRQRNIRLPVGAKGEDGLLNYLFRTDLQGGRDDNHTWRIISSESALFYFDSLSLLPADLKLYWRRLLRYSERYFQSRILYHILRRHGVQGLPRHIREIYTDENIRTLRPRNRLLYFVSDRVVLNKIKRGVLFSQLKEKTEQVM